MRRADLEELVSQIRDSGAKVSTKSGKLLVRFPKGTAIIKRVRLARDELRPFFRPLENELLGAVERVFGPCEKSVLEDVTDSRKKWMEYATNLLGQTTERGRYTCPRSEIDTALICLRPFASDEDVTKAIELTIARRRVRSLVSKALTY